MNRSIKHTLKFLFLLILALQLFDLFSLSTVQAAGTTPVTADVADNNSALKIPQRRHIGYAQNRFWIIWCYSTGDPNFYKAMYTSSTDGTSWASTSTLVGDLWGGSGHGGLSLASYWTETYVHLGKSWWNPVTNQPLIYRRMTINGAAQTISGGTDYVAVPAGADYQYRNPNIIVDSNGYPWIGYERYEPTNWRPWIVQATATDGSTWGTPHQLNTLGVDGWSVVPVALTNGKVYALYCNNFEGDHYILGQLWDGSSWGSEEQASLSYANYGDSSSWHRYTAVTDGDIIHLTYHSRDNRVVYRKRTASGWEGTETTLASSVSYDCSPSITIDPISKDLFVFWFGADNILYMRRKTASGWLSPETPFGTSFTSPARFTLNTYMEMIDCYIGVAWMEGANVKHAYFSADPPTYSNIGVSSTAAATSVTFSCRWDDESALSHWIFSTNNTGVWQNGTAVAFTSTPSWANVTKTLNSTVGLVIGYCWYANDTCNLWNDTNILTLTTIGIRYVYVQIKDRAGAPVNTYVNGTLSSNGARNVTDLAPISYVIVIRKPNGYYPFSIHDAPSFNYNGTDYIVSVNLTSQSRSFTVYFSADDVPYVRNADYPISYSKYSNYRLTLHLSIPTGSYATVLVYSKEAPLKILLDEQEIWQSKTLSEFNSYTHSTWFYDSITHLIYIKAYPLSLVITNVDYRGSPYVPTGGPPPAPEITIPWYIQMMPTLRRIAIVALIVALILYVRKRS